MSEVTRILNHSDQGDPVSPEQLLPLVYEELRRLAAAHLTQEKVGQTLQATALVHEAYLRLVDQSQQQWDNPRHFFAAAAEAMRRILIERARRKRALKHGGQHQRVDWELAIEPCVLPLACDDILGLNEALQKLEQEQPRKAELVKLRFFAGLNVIQAAQALGVSTSTAENDWAYARSWLKLEMSGHSRNESV